MKRSMHNKINLRPQIIKAIFAAAKVKGENTQTPEFAINAALRANKMMLFH